MYLENLFHLTIIKMHNLILISILHGLCKNNLILDTQLQTSASKKLDG